MMKSVLGLSGMSRDEIGRIFGLAAQFVSSDDRPQTPEPYRRALSHTSVALMFFEPSTRTRASFELAIARLGGYPLAFASDASSMQKGENELHTCMNLQAMGVDAFVIRHHERHIPHQLDEQLQVPILNAGNGADEHPTQGLLDLFTICRTLGRDSLEGIRVAIIGDIVHSRVARSNAYGLRALGASVVVAGPPQLLPTDRDAWDVDFADTRVDALKGAHFVIALRVQRERMQTETMDADAYVRLWGINEDVVQGEMRSDAWLMHPGPVMRGVEMTGGVADSQRSLILKQAAYGVAVRQAVLLHAMDRA